MAIYSGMFNSVNGDRKYNAWWFAKYFSTFIGNGVFPNPSTNLQVLENESMTTTVKPGTGWINGYFIYSDSDYVLEHDLADGVLKRIDRVVMRLNHTTRQIEIDIKKGSFASNPVAPSLQQDEDYHELALADVLINNGATQITQANITDHRLNGELCGIVSQTVKSVDTTTLFNQYQSWIQQQKEYYEENIENWTADQQADFLAWREEETTDFDTWQATEKQVFYDWVETLEGILSGDVAGNLLQMIDENTQRIENHAEVMATKEVAGHVILGDGLEVGDDGRVKTNTAELRTELSDRIDRNSYDDYQLWLELYYKGVIGQVEAANAKAIMFDGFMNTDMIASGSEMVDVREREVVALPGTKTKAHTVNSATRWNFSSNFNTAHPTSQQTIAFTDPSFTQFFRYSTTYDFGELVYLKNFSCMYSTIHNVSYIRINPYDIQVSDDGNAWRTIQIDHKGTHIRNSSNYVNLDSDLRDIIRCRYFRIREEIQVNPLNLSSIVIRPMVFKVSRVEPIEIIYKPKSLPFEGERVTLYLSAKNTKGSRTEPYIFIDKEGVYRKIPEVRLRSDSKFSGFTETVYELEENISEIQLKLILYPTDDEIYSTVVKRLGLIVN